MGLVALAGGAALVVSALTGSTWQMLSWLPAVFLGIVAVFCFQAARSVAGHADCPHCGRSLGADPAETARAIHCSSCNEYARVIDGRLERLPEDWVDAEPRFTVAIPHDQIRWPGCAMCGAPPSRWRVHDHVVPDTELNMLINAVGLTVGGILRAGGGRLYQLSVPYCDVHDECVELDVESRALVIRFRSLPAANAFRAMNGGAPPA